MKAKIICLFITLIICVKGFGQQLYPFKESYDQFLEPYYTSNTYDYNNDATKWWESWGMTLLSYLRMFEATHDKAYLNKFIKHSYNIQLRRGTYVYWQSLPDNGTRLLYTGQLLRPMAEFVYIVKNDNTLYNTNLLSGLIPSTLSTPTQIILGYGDYANWLEARVEHTLNYLKNVYWIDDDNCFRHCANCSNDPDAINFNANYASAMFFIGSVNPTNYSDYTYKAEQIVIFFRNRVLEFTPNHSYTWFHIDDPDCSSIGVPCREDVSHGAMDIQIPLVAYQLYGNGLYSPYEMNGFAHTFSKNIWRGSNNYDVFHNNIFGLDAELTDGSDLNSCGYPPNGTQNFYGPGEVLAWMSLYPFDDFGGEPNDIYTTLITQAKKILDDYNGITALVPSNYCYSTTRYLSGAQSFQGLSEVIKAQWDKECGIDLHLFNRDVRYDQDFYARNDLIVAPQENYSPPATPPTNITHYTSGVTLPFAEPQTFLGGGPIDRFVVENSVTSNMTAGESITLKPGFHAKSGSNFMASITPCSQQHRPLPFYQNENNSTSNNFSAVDSINSSHTIASSNMVKPLVDKPFSMGSRDINFYLYPSPTTTGSFTISFFHSSQSLTNIFITDIIGNEISRFKKPSSKTFEIDLSSQPKGIYFVKVIEGSRQVVKKIILM
jgi:hypothetical protein